MIDEYYTFKIFGYHSDDLKPKSHKYVVVVCDACGLYQSIQMRQYSCNSDMCKPCAHLIPKEPLPNGWQSKLSDITDNKLSPVYLGRIAETILSNIYNDVRVMPNNNHGFDVICNRDFKIDIKSSATGYKGFWWFNITKNQITDYFLCIAFESRGDLHNPMHLWMIPGNIINHLSTLKISKATIDKWQQYELSLNKLLICCNNHKI